MRLLLDTHTLAWWVEDNPSIGKAARAAIEDEANTVLISAVSVYEASYKHATGKWPEAGALLQRLDDLLVEQEFRPLPISLEHARRAGELAPAHRDPWDRLLAAQALVDDLTIVSIDDKLDQFGVKRLW